MIVWQNARKFRILELGIKHRVCSCCRHATKIKSLFESWNNIKNWHFIHNWCQKKCPNTTQLNTESKLARVQHAIKVIHSMMQSDWSTFLFNVVLNKLTLCKMAPYSRLCCLINCVCERWLPNRICHTDE